MKKRRAPDGKVNNTTSDFGVEAEYADSIFRMALGDSEGALARLKRALELKPTYAPAILSMGSVEYQRGRRDEGQRLFQSLLSLPEDTPDLCKIIDEAGSFLIQIGAYKDGAALYRRAIERFPAVAVLHQGLGRCAGHEGRHDEAIAASERAVQLEPDNQKFVNDLGWSLLETGRLEEAKSVLERAVPWIRPMNWRERTFASRRRSQSSGRRGLPPHRDVWRRPRASQALASRQQGQSLTPPLPISAPGSALGLLPSIALPSAQAMPSLREASETPDRRRCQLGHLKFPYLGALPPNPQDLSHWCQDGSHEPLLG